MVRMAQRVAWADPDIRLAVFTGVSGERQAIEAHVNANVSFIVLIGACCVGKTYIRINCVHPPPE